MKVVLFCGGYGMRMRNDRNDQIPKPMQMVGPRPILWHIMRYYAHFGHKEFILCLGYGASEIKNFFLDYHEEQSNDFILHDNTVDCLSTDISDWRITFVDTGLESAIGERLRRVRRHLEGDEYFLANYADVLTDAPLDEMIDRYHRSGATASMLVVPPQSSFHCVDVAENGEIKEIVPVSRFPIWENGGYFVLSQAIFDLLPPAAIWWPTSAAHSPARAGCTAIGTVGSGNRRTRSRNVRNWTTTTLVASTPGPYGSRPARR